MQAKRGLVGLVPATVGSALLAAASPVAAGSGHGDGGLGGRAALGAGKINHIVVIDLENEDFATTFGDASPARFLNDVLVPQGQLIDHYYATSHVSQGNYIPPALLMRDSRRPGRLNRQALLHLSSPVAPRLHPRSE